MNVKCIAKAAGSEFNIKRRKGQAYEISEDIAVELEKKGLVQIVRKHVATAEEMLEKRISSLEAQLATKPPAVKKASK